MPDYVFKEYQQTAPADLELFRKWMNLHQHIVANVSLKVFLLCLLSTSVASREALKEGEKLPELKFDEVESLVEGYEDQREVWFLRHRRSV